MWRQDSFGKDNNDGKIAGRGERGRPNMWWIDFIKETISISV